VSVADDEALAAVRERVDRYEQTGDQDAVLGSGVLAQAGRLWRAVLSPGGTTVEVAHALARLHWAREKALGLDAPIDELWGAMLLYARVSNVDPALVPEEVLGLLAPQPVIDHSFVGPEHWGRRAIALLKKAQVDGDQVDLDDAIELFSGTVEAFPQEHEFWAGDMSNLSLALRLRYDRRGDPADLDRAEKVARAAVRATAPTDPHLPGRLDNLSTALSARASRTGDLVAGMEAVRLSSRAVRTAPPHFLHRLVLEENLAAARMVRFHLTGDRDELDRAVTELTGVVAATTQDDQELPRRRGLLGAALHTLFQSTGDPHHLHQAVELLTMAADATLRGSLDQAYILSDLSSALLTRFEETGSPQDLDDAVAASERSVTGVTGDDPSRPGRLHTWGQALLAVSEYTGQPQFLDQAIAAFREAVDSLAPDARREAAHSASLGMALMARQFALLRRITPFGISELASDEARLQWERMQDSGELANLAERGLLEDLAAAHEAQRRAVEQAGPHHPDLGRYLRGLSDTSYSRYRAFGHENDANQAIELCERAVRVIPPHHPEHARAVLQLARFLADLDGSASADRVLSLWRGLVSQRSTEPSVRAAAAGYAARALVRRGEWGAATEQYSQALEILPSLVSPAQDRTAQEDLLTRWGGLSAEAASCAIAAGDPERALELLEQGRGVLWSQLLDSRTELSALAAVDSDLADRLTRVERELNAPPAAKSAEPWWGRIADRRLTLAAERDELLERVRSLPALAGFRRPADAAELRRAAAAGPIALIVSSQWRTDALIVTTTATQTVPLRSIDYPQLLARTGRYLTALDQYESGSRDALAQVRLNLLITSTLAWLWHDIAEPVLTALGHTRQPPPAVARPRMWWCPTGPLALLPLHAAGLSSVDGACVLDRVTPSYTPTLRALLDRPAATGSAGLADRMLMVAMPITPGHRPLPQVAGELTTLRELIPRSTLLQGEQATREAVRDALHTHRWAHLSCHGGQDLLRPSQGGIVLHDAVLTVADIQVDRYTHGEFVFLSACQTALGGADIPDEAITVANAFQFAGWRQVIGTLWSVGAATAAELSADLYGVLITDGTVHTEGAAEALYHAVRRLRASGHAPLVWAPYVHSGA
jgi:tetratricopeptide (TPR) repeat protein